MRARMVLLTRMVAFLVCLAGTSGTAGAGIVLDVDSELRLLDRGQTSPLRIPGARFRVAVFTYEDPDGTGLGDALAALIGQEVLLHSRVSSIGVLRYEGSLAPSASDPTSYFDKVERLAEAQQVTLALWGIVRKSGDRIAVDTFAQLSRQAVEGSFVWRLRLPFKMGRGELMAHLQPDRMHLQHREMTAAAGATLQAGRRRVNELRARPDDEAPLTASLPVGAVYWITERRGDWARLDAGTHGAGWVQAAGYCPGECAALLDGARFASGLLSFMAARTFPPVAPGLTLDAQAVFDQLVAVQVFNSKAPDKADAIADRWLAPSSPGGAVAPPGGAAFANLRALARMALEIKYASQRRPVDMFDNIVVPPDRVRSIAYDLARASLGDPRNLDVLRNLEVLFRYVGDTNRAWLARQLADEAASRK